MRASVNPNPNLWSTPCALVECAYETRTRHAAVLGEARGSHEGARDHHGDVVARQMRFRW